MNAWDQQGFIILFFPFLLFFQLVPLNGVNLGGATPITGAGDRVLCPVQNWTDGTDWNDRSVQSVGLNGLTGLTVLTDLSVQSVHIPPYTSERVAWVCRTL